MQQQRIGGDQQNLEEHEQVEHIPREERTVQARQLQLEERMEMRTLPREPQRRGQAREGNDGR